LCYANGYFDDFHTPPTVTLPAGTTLADGSTLAMDYYVMAPTYGFQGGACLTHPDIQQYMTDNIASVSAQFPENTGYFLGYDEMRHMHSCSLCKAAYSTAGELLAWHVGQAINTVRTATVNGTSTNTNSKIYVWNDMFDPNHNAHNNYYLVDGDITGSWLGLPTDTIVMNWHLGSNDSAKFFAGLKMNQIIAGYYDSGEGTDSAISELAAFQGVPGLLGLMYTTFADDYSQLENYAAGAISAWNSTVVYTSTGGSATTTGMGGVGSCTTGTCPMYSYCSSGTCVCNSGYSINGNQCVSEQAQNDASIQATSFVIFVSLILLLF